MRALLLVGVLRVAPDAGVEVDHAYRREVVLAQARCFESDGGVPPVLIRECRVWCEGEDGFAALPDGGRCYVPPPLIPVQGGDFWLPGQWPYGRTK